jgi:hypothetical protein
MRSSNRVYCTDVCVPVYKLLSIGFVNDVLREVFSS